MNAKNHSVLLTTKKLVRNKRKVNTVCTLSPVVVFKSSSLLFISALLRSPLHRLFFTVSLSRCLFFALFKRSTSGWQNKSNRKYMNAFVYALCRANRFAYKDEYEKFKLVLTVIVFVFSFTCAFLLSYRWGSAPRYLLLAGRPTSLTRLLWLPPRLPESWTHCSTSCWCGTTARSPSGRASSSATAPGASPRPPAPVSSCHTCVFPWLCEDWCAFRIKGWWVFHHYVSTFMSGVMLTWYVLTLKRCRKRLYTHAPLLPCSLTRSLCLLSRPDGVLYHMFRQQFLTYCLYQSKILHNITLWHLMICRFKIQDSRSFPVIIQAELDLRSLSAFCHRK